MNTFLKIFLNYCKYPKIKERSLVKINYVFLAMLVELISKHEEKDPSSCLSLDEFTNRKLMESSIGNA